MERRSLREAEVLFSREVMRSDRKCAGWGGARLTTGSDESKWFDAVPVEFWVLKFKVCKCFQI